ncbi:MAG TPA: hypothetical protein VK841_10025 [Polyangiaceae bacterium]|nr:hypothetical protein [Polyangiaceae bacterium]
MGISQAKRMGAVTTEVNTSRLVMISHPHAVAAMVRRTRPRTCK